LILVIVLIVLVYLYFAIPVVSLSGGIDKVGSLSWCKL